MTLEEGLKVYQALASKLPWSEYFKLLKTLLFKLNKATSKATAQSGSDPELEMERIVTKCICNLLTGFHFEKVPDAIDTIKQQEEKLE